MKWTFCVTYMVPGPQGVGKKGLSAKPAIEGLTRPLCLMVAMGTVPVLLEARRTISYFEEGLRAVFLQSAWPRWGRKPRARTPLLLGVWWSHAHTQPARRGQCGNVASRKSPVGQ